MYIQQIYTNCLAHAAYYIESDNEVAIIDPLRDYEQYTQLASSRNATIKYIIETHFHADFVSGHIDLAEHTGGTIVFGPGAKPGYKAYNATDGEILHLGKAKLKILHTPGHTVESICCLLIDEEGKEEAVFTGDTLFVGDVGRPDLMSGNLTKETLAAMLFDSLHDKLKPLNDNIVVYPGHGAGSACGKNIGKEAFSTIGDQKRNNYAMKEEDKDKFIKIVSGDLPTPPAYFFRDASINIKGYDPIDNVIARNLKPLSVAEFKEKVTAGSLILDTRKAPAFSEGFIKGAINIGLNGDFAVWVGSLIDIDAPLLLVTDAGKEKEAVTRLARIGFENVGGYLAGGMESWQKSGGHYDKIMTLTSKEYEALVQSEDCSLLDVRNRLEVARNRMSGSVHIPLTELKKRMNSLDKNKKWLVYCAGGYRSMIAASMLKASGFLDIMNIEGGINNVLENSPQLVDLGM